MVREFPTTFIDEPEYVGPHAVWPKHSLALSQLANKGLVVVAGLSRSDVPSLTEIAAQLGTQEYCPNDLLKRWADEQTTEKQLAKDGGRAVFQLKSMTDGQTVAYGWTGLSSADERAFLPDCAYTFAVRIHENLRGQGLGTPFTRAIVAGSMALYGARRIGLETWGSNSAAVRTYLKAGAELVATKDDKRLTLREDQADPSLKGLPQRRDVRLFMKFPWSF